MPDKSRDDLRQAYDANALFRDRSAFPEWKRAERDRFLSHLQAAGSKQLLEIGAGTGRDARFFADADCKVMCIDLSPEMIQLCLDKGLEAQVMDVAGMSFPDASFEAVYAFNSLLHLPKRELPSVLQEIRRVLAPGGLFYFGTYGGYDHEGIYKKDDHTPHRFFSFYEAAHIRHVVSQCFDVLELQSLEIPGTSTRIRFQSILLQRPVRV